MIRRWINNARLGHKVSSQSSERKYPKKIRGQEAEGRYCIWLLDSGCPGAYISFSSRLFVGARGAHDPP